MTRILAILIAALICGDSANAGEQGYRAAPQWLYQLPSPLGNNGVFVTDGSGNPSISTTAPSGLTIPSPTISGSLGASANGLTLQILAGGGNTFLGGGPGEWAGGSITTGAENTFIGDKAGGNVTTGSFNFAAGHNAMGVGASVAVTSTNNTYIGTDAGRNISDTGGFNTVVGNAAMEGLTGAAASNTIMGQGAAASLTGGSANTIIGKGADISGSAFNNTTVVGQGSKGGGNSAILGQGAGTSQGSSANHNILIGQGVAPTTLTTANHVIIICTTASSCDTNTGNTITIEGIITATGTGTPSTSASTIAGTLNISGGYAGSGGSAIPTCNTALKGARAYVTDAATTPTFLGTYTAGAGAVTAPVFCNGSNWVYG